MPESQNVRNGLRVRGRVQVVTVTIKGAFFTRSSLACFFFPLFNTSTVTVLSAGVTAACGYREWACGDGKCIDAWLKCTGGSPDCSDGSDEDAAMCDKGESRCRDRKLTAFKAIVAIRVEKFDFRWDALYSLKVPMGHMTFILPAEAASSIDPSSNPAPQL